MAKIKSDAHFYLSIGGATMPTPIDITSVTNTNPAVVTLAAALPPTGAVVGDLLQLNDTGEPKLDGFAFRIAAIDVTTPAAPELTLADFDGTTMAGPVSTGEAVVLSMQPGAELFAEACMVSITIAGQAPDSIDLDDMCGTATVLGSAKPPTFSFSGFVDKDKAGFRNLIAASLEDPKTTHYAIFDFSDLGGYVAGPVEIGEISVTANYGQGLQFSGSGVFTEMPTYSWAL